MTCFTAEGFTAHIGRIEARTRALTLADGTFLSDVSPPYHEFTRVGDTVYDAIQGLKECTLTATKIFSMKVFLMMALLV